MKTAYLEQYRRTVEVDYYKGVSGFFRRALDRRAQAAGQPDRHALTLERIFELDEYTPSVRTSILEIGCGNGLALSYRSGNVAYSAIDVGDTYRGALEARGVHFDVVDVSSQALPYADGTFRFVLLNHVIEHIAAYDHFASELARVLAPEGCLYVRTPNILLDKGFWNDYTHVKPYTPLSLTALMEAHGLRLARMFDRSDHGRISVDILTRGRLRGALFGRVLGGREIEAIYKKDGQSVGT